MRILRLKEYKGVIQYLGFERKMMTEIDFVCQDSQHNTKSTYLKQRVRKSSLINRARGRCSPTSARSPRNNSPGLLS